MSEKQVRMVALVGGKITSVGTCHPGQARLLQKQKMAEWKGGKLWLRNPMATEEPSEEAWSIPVAPNRDRVVGTLTNRGVPKHIREEIDPDGLLQREPEFQGEPVIVSCVDAQDFMVKLWSRKQQGHELIWHDEPRARRMGFMDYTSHEWVQIGLSSIKRTWPNVQVEGMSLDALGKIIFTSQAVRGLLPSSTDDFIYHMDRDAPDEEVDASEADLESLWESAPKHPSNVTMGSKTICVTENEDGQVMFDLAIEGVEQRDVLSVAEGFKMRGNSLGWTQFSWPHDKDRVPVCTLDAEGNRVPFPDFPEGVTADGMYFRKGDSLLRMWHRVRGTDWDIAWDESRILYTENEGMVYVLVSSTPRSDKSHKAALKRAQDLGTVAPV